MREWVVASGLVEGDGGLLLVKNRRRDGAVDWSPPGGVIEVHDGEAVPDGLTREVAEETGITVTHWDGPLWEVEADAPAMGWRLRVEVHRALGWVGSLHVDDPDGIVVEARFVAPAQLAAHLAGTWLPTHEPLTAWVAEPWTGPRRYRYHVEGSARASMVVTRL